MECPHCGAPGPIGRARCVACGGSLTADQGPETGAVSFEPVPETVALFPERKKYPWDEEEAAPKTEPFDFEAASLPTPAPRSPEPEAPREAPRPARRARPRAADSAPPLEPHAFGTLPGARPVTGPVSGPAAGFAVPTAPTGPTAPPEPPTGPAGAPPLAEDAADAESATLCRVCLAPFQVAPGGLPNLCGPCGAGAGEQTAEVVPLIGDIPYPTHDARPLRPDSVRAPVRRRANLRGGVIAAIAGVIIAAGVGVVSLIEPEADPFAGSFEDVRLSNGVLRVMVPGKKSLAFETRSDLRIVYESTRSGSSSYEPRLDVLQETVARADITLIERRSAGDLVHVASDCEAELEIVRVSRGREVERQVYPWHGHKGDLRIYLPPTGQPTVAGGGAPLPGRDLPPLVNLSATGAGPREVQPGDDWTASVPLPFLSDRQARVSAHAFDARFEYVGRETAHGHECLVLRMRALLQKPLPASLRRMDRSSGVVHGLLYYDSRTGLIVHGDLRADLVLERTKGGGGERLRLEGRVVVSGP